MQEDKQLAVYRRMAQELLVTAERLKKENEALRESLQYESTELRGSDITPRMLEQSRLDVAAAQSRLESIKNLEQARIEAMRLAEEDIARINTEIRELGSPDDAEGQARLARLQSNLEQSELLRAATSRLVEDLKTIREQAEVRRALLRERLIQRQDRFKLPALDAMVLRSDPRRERLQTETDVFMEKAARLGNEAAAVVGDAPNALARKYLLEIQAQDAQERADLKQREIRLLQIERALSTYNDLLEVESVPVDSLRTARLQMQEVSSRLQREQDELQQKGVILRNQRRTVEQRGEIADAAEKTFDRQLAVLDELLAALNAQAKRVDALTQSALETRERLGEVLGEGVRRSFRERRTLPPDARGWRRLGNELAVLPAQVVRELGRAVVVAAQRIGSASLPTIGLLVAAESVLVLFVLWLRRFMKRTVLQARPESTIAVPVRSLHKTLPGLLVAAAWFLLGRVLQLADTEILLLLSLLLVWPVIRFLLDLAHQILLEQEAFGTHSERSRFYRELRWVLVLVAVLFALSVVAHAVAVSPVAEDAIDRISMLCLLLIALPALHLRSLVMSSYRQQVKQQLWTRAAAAIGLAVPLVIAGSAFLGVVGYVNLAWSIAAHLGWLALVVAGWLFAFGVLRDGVRLLSQRLAQRSEKADFWARNFLMPVYRLASLGLAVLAGFVLVHLYGWSAETPVVRWIPRLLDTTLFRIGEATMRVQDLALAVLLVFIVFWAGSWSKQVTYRLAYVRVTDPGIRQSLSTFTQYVVIVFGLMIALKTIGLDLTALTVFAGALGVGIGFGLQNITSNFISGILLLAERPLRVSDLVTVANFEGEVTRIGIRSLTVKTFDNQEVIIPNSSVISEPFTNWTRGDDVMRTVLMVGVSYDADPNEAIALIAKVLEEHPAVLTDPAPKVLLWDYGDSAVMIRVHLFGNIRGAVGRLDLRSQVLLAIWDRLHEAGITIPFPQRDVHVRSVTGGDTLGALAAT